MRNKTLALQPKRCGPGQDHYENTSTQWHFSLAIERFVVIKIKQFLSVNADASRNVMQFAGSTESAGESSGLRNTAAAVRGKAKHSETFASLPEDEAS